MKDVEYSIWLQQALGYGAPIPDGILAALREPDGAQKLYSQDGGALVKIEGLTRVQLRRLWDKSLDEARKAAGICLERGWKVVTFGDEDYPKSLENIFAPPCVLYICGDWESVRMTPAVAMVGTRKITAYGMEAATKLAIGIASHGATVVSGLALGVDGAAHRGALKGGGKTIAVIGCGPDVDYPAAHRELRRLIEQNGAVVSEYPPGVRPSQYTFPVRNRIIAGLSLGTLVIEAGARSGSLITANLAAEMGRDVFAVPGSIFSPMSEGTNKLLRDGAKPVACAADVLDEYSPRFPELARPAKAAYTVPDAAPGRITPAAAVSAADKPGTERSAPARLPQNLTDVQRKVLGMLGSQPEHVDNIALKANLEPRSVLGALTILEIEGLARSFPGRRFAAM